MRVGTITLTQGQLSVASDVTIDGGTGVTVDADQLSRVLTVAGEETDVTLAHLTVTGGSVGSADGGGGILAGDGAGLTLRSCAVVGNDASGANGGGIAVDGGSLVLVGTTVGGNSSAFSSYGGGISVVGGSLSITDSTIVNNRGYNGAEIFVSDGAVDITNSTMANNIGVAGVGIHSGRALTLTNNTVTGNDARSPVGLGGGILQSGGSLTLRNSIVAGNVSSTSNDAPDISGSIASSNGANIFGSDVAGNVAGDLENVSTALLFAGGLADNGGPTQTFALRDAADNPAIAGADPDDAPATDQRGLGRPGPAGTEPDIGAFELGGLPPSEDIVGTKGKDFLKGTGEGDVIRGLAGNDTLFGLEGDDRLFGGNGKDSLFGKAVIDQLTGGLGADRFVFRTTGEAPPDGPAYDEILDFNRAEGDKIDLRTIDANESAPGNQPFRFVGTAAVSGPAQLHVEAFDGDFLVTGNVDVDPAADFALVVRTDLASLRAADFLL